ncbi:MBL fold metallo-hydrolase [Natronoflexus pectinivorans]|uniref:Phosphoribosyl 1,2-cyclic phosphate phosphodiesterase n=1 Tax=Natronoflexus pectinivorans TaxID=682526 RepID=A0A4R2GK78_9BACT|nr:MBL fold metallo-hydrolase [Natronoflexus pectinivorans]TCO09172.1 phosphoribosyl 1,2-cyclic phosphate phosphodiesterase [Natronoflexus pectinivorans]
MTITILGSGTSLGVPMIACKCIVCRSTNPKDKRLRSSVLIQTAGKNIVIDAGPDFRQQMLASGISHLDAILITHAHKDHTAGLDDVRAFNWINNTHANVYAEASVIESIKQEFAYAFSESKYPGLPEIVLNNIDNKPFIVDSLPVVPIRVMHHRLPVLGFRIGDFSYITDANHIPEGEYEKLYGTKLLVIDGLRYEPHISHFTLQQALEVIDRINPERAYITHISHQLGLHSEVNKTLPPGVELAFDGLRLELI